MARIVAPVEGYTGLVVGVPFVGGAATTSDPGALAYFRRHGYQVDTGAASAPVEAPAPAAVVPVLPAKPKVEDLRAYAEAKGIDLTGLSRKADLVAAIAAAEGTGPATPAAEDNAAGSTLAAPTDVVATAGADVVTVTWTAPDGDVTGFEVESIELDPDVADPDVVIDECTDTTLVVEELVEGVAHQFRVRAVTEAGLGDWSEPVTATPGAGE
jgi:hypothetical protein